MSKVKLELIWIGKDVRPQLEPRIMIEDSSYSYCSNSSPRECQSDNTLIQGDNLLALKALAADPSVRGKVKCVFIDPPYNTGSAFEHYDDGIEHSLWLGMMRDRLEILKDLLSEDGSIWITVDDNESHYLKVLCDGIFGRKNFVANAVWQKKYTVANDAKWLSDNHDHVLVYAINKATWRPNRLGRSAEMDARYKNPDGHPKGPWKATPLHAKSGSSKSGKFSYTFKNGRTWSPPPGTYPRFSPETMAALEQDGAIWFGSDGKAAPSRKTFLSELSTSGPPSPTVWLHTDVGNNHEAREEVKQFNPADPFSTPKPERLVARVLELATNPGDLVLDSFAGSGTTGAVAHKMGRRWIMVELGEHAKTHIAPRMNKVIDGKDKGGVSEVAGWNGGGGYRFFRLAPSLLEKDHWGNWVIAKAYNPAMLSEAMCKHFGFTYAPSSEHYWMHGQSAETSFIYVTTNSLTFDQLRAISDEVGENRSLLICCTAYDSGAEKLANMTVKKIPQAVLSSCEWGKDDYSLKIESLPMMAEDEEEDLPATKPARQGKRDKDTGDLFAGDSDGDQA